MPAPDEGHVRDDVYAFLISIVPPMAHLKDLFIAAGLKNNEYLAALARMPEDVVKKFLAEELPGITPFDRFAIIQRLKTSFQ